VTPSRRPGRPRSPEADRAILSTALELLAEEGLQGLRMEGVAARAGVGKTTIYRRFASAHELAAAALATLTTTLGPRVDTGSVDGDLRAQLQRRVDLAPSTRWNLLMPRLVVEAAGDPELHALVRRVLIDPERAAIVEIVRRGIARGELRRELDPELVTDALIGPLVYRVLIEAGDVSGLADRFGRLLPMLRAGLDP
jgi:AcrR family transcriptional regulator